MEASPPQKQKYIAKTVIKICRQEKVYVDQVSLYLRQLRRRWYDRDETVCLAIEHLKEAPFEVQTKVAGKILRNIEKIEAFLEKNPLPEKSGQEVSEKESNFF